MGISKYHPGNCLVPNQYLTPQILIVHCWHIHKVMLYFNCPLLAESLEMKVTYKKSMNYKVLKKIRSIQDNIILRQDIADLGSDRQVSRALQALVKEKILARLGYGVYVKLIQSKITGDIYLAVDFVTATRDILTKLNIEWELSQDEQDYNAGITQQVPVRPVTKIKTRFRRKLSYQGMELRTE